MCCGHLPTAITVNCSEDKHIAIPLDVKRLAKGKVLTRPFLGAIKDVVLRRGDYYVVSCIKHCCDTRTGMKLRWISL